MPRKKQEVHDRSKFTECVSDAERLCHIRKMLQTSDAWLIRGLLAIHAKQTADEQDARTTRERNHVGFSAFDADFLTGLADRVLAEPNRPLTEKQIAAVRKAMMKYAGQLLRISKGQA